VRVAIWEEFSKNGSNLKYQLTSYEEALKKDKSTLCFNISKKKVEEILRNINSKKIQEFLRSCVLTRFLYEST